MAAITQFLSDHMTFSLMLRIFLSGLIGALIGIEREVRLKEAGVKTHLIVCLGSTLFMVVSKYGFDDLLNNPFYRADATRIASQVVSGVGFLGAGIIFVRKHGVQGLTTAAGVWTTSGVGLAIGAGMYAIGIFSAVLVIVAQLVIYHYGHILNIPETKYLVITIKNNPGALMRTLTILESNKVEIVNFELLKARESSRTVELLVKIPFDLEPIDLLATLDQSDEVLSAAF